MRIGPFEILFHFDNQPNTVATTKEGTSLLDELKCTVCVNLMTDKICLCNTGHSLCMDCTLKVDVCPLCHDDFPGARNYFLENLIKKISIPCKYKPCNYSNTCDKIEQHENQCIYNTNKNIFNIIINLFRKLYKAFVWMFAAILILHFTKLGHYYFRKTLKRLMPILYSNYNTILDWSMIIFLSIPSFLALFSIMYFLLKEFVIGILYAIICLCFELLKYVFRLATRLFSFKQNNTEEIIEDKED